MSQECLAYKLKYVFSSSWKGLSNNQYVYDQSVVYNCRYKVTTSSLGQQVKVLNCPENEELVAAGKKKFKKSMFVLKISSNDFIT